MQLCVANVQLRLIYSCFTLLQSQWTWAASCSVDWGLSTTSTGRSLLTTTPTCPYESLSISSVHLASGLLPFQGSVSHWRGHQWTWIASWSLRVEQNGDESLHHTLHLSCFWHHRVIQVCCHSKVQFLTDLVTMVDVYLPAVSMVGSAVNRPLASGPALGGTVSCICGAEPNNGHMLISSRDELFSWQSCWSSATGQ